MDNDQARNESCSVMCGTRAVHMTFVSKNARQETGEKIKWGSTETAVCPDSGNVRVICMGDLCHDCKELMYMTGWANSPEAWLEKFENEPPFRDTMDMAAENMKEITPEDREKALREQNVKTMQNIRMRVQTQFDLFTLDQYSLKFKHRAQKNRKVCICKVKNQEGEMEVLVVVPRDEPRRLIIEHDCAVGMQQDLMPYVIMPNQCISFFDQERRRQCADHPMAAQQKHSKFYFNTSALLEEMRQREEEAAKEEAKKSLDGAIANMSNEKRMQLKALTADSNTVASAPSTPAGLPKKTTPAPSTPGMLSRMAATAAPSTPGWASGSGRPTPSFPGPAPVSSKDSNPRDSPPCKAHSLSSRLDAPRRGGRWCGQLSARGSAASRESSRSSGTGRLVGGGGSTMSSAASQPGAMIDLDAQEMESRLWDFKAMLVGTFIWTNHNVFLN